MNERQDNSLPDILDLAEEDHKALGENPSIVERFEHFATYGVLAGPTRTTRETTMATRLVLVNTLTTTINAGNAIVDSLKSIKHTVDY